MPVLRRPVEIAGVFGKLESPSRTSVGRASGNSRAFTKSTQNGAGPTVRWVSEEDGHSNDEGQRERAAAQESRLRTSH
jgi:hypothetical protein